MKPSARFASVAILFSLLAFLSGPSGAQIIVAVASPPPGQFHIEDLWTLQLSNTGAEPFELYLQGTIEEAGSGLVLAATSNSFTLAGSETRRVVVGDISPVRVDHTDSRYEEILTRTGSLPEGLYSVCVTAIDAVSGIELGEGCILQQVVHPAPPQPIAPADATDLQDELPIFTWMPPMPLSPGSAVTYELRMAEVLAHQGPNEALDANPVWLKAGGLVATSYRYPLAARPLETGATYAWQVTAITAEGWAIPASEVFQFHYRPIAAQGITPIWPVAACVSEVTQGLQTATVPFEWEAGGEFESFALILYENPCGKHPPPPTPTPTPTPTPSPAPTPAPGPGGGVTPTPTPTPTPAPGPGPSAPGGGAPSTPDEPEEETPPDDSGPGGAGPTVPADDDWGDDDAGDDGLPEPPPGWEWTPQGLRWVGPGPEPPELPPGWEWGPVRPGQVAGSAPVDQRVVGGSGTIPADGNWQIRPGSYAYDFYLGEWLRPGQAFVYQIYGAYRNVQGEQVGYLSEPQCLRFSLPDETGEEPQPEKCGGCTLDYVWLKKTPIKVVSPLDHHPKDAATLAEMLPAACIALSIRAEDVDVLKQICVGCTRDSAIARIGPIEHGIHYSWTLNGTGKLLATSGPTVFYQLPPTAPCDTPARATITCGLANLPGKARDDPIDGKIEFEILMIDSCKCLAVTVKKLEQPKEKQYDEDCEPQEARDCNPLPPKWEEGAQIAGALTLPPKLCPHSAVILAAGHADSDELTLVCEAEACGRDEERQTLADPLHYQWSDGAAGGLFPLGNDRAKVLYIAPADTGKTITFTVDVRDSRTQFSDPDKKETGQSATAQLLDLTEITTNRQGEYSNITTGYPHHFIPHWEPGAAQVKRIEWELDLGGAKGKFRKILCDPAMTPEKATLRFTNKSKPEQLKELEVSWKLLSHTHGIKTLACRIFGEACGTCCTCVDSVWAKKEGGFVGRDTLKWNEFRLFFDKDHAERAFRDDGRVRNARQVADGDEYGEETELFTDPCAAWFLHWSSSTYGACRYNHADRDPIVRYDKGHEVEVRDGGKVSSFKCKGLYWPPTETIYLTDGASEKSKRKAFTGKKVFFVTSAGRYFDASRVTQPAYDLAGHQECNRVYLHEYGHYLAMTANWRPGGDWREAYGPRTQEDHPATDRNGQAVRVRADNHELRIIMRKAGNYTGERKHGLDAIQKYNFTIEVYRGRVADGDLRRTIRLADAWPIDGIRRPPRDERRWPEDGNGRFWTPEIRGGFEIENATDRWAYSPGSLQQYQRANDPDDDFVPNRVEDEIGLNWNSVRTHPGHKRGRLLTSDGEHAQVPDQEFYADYHFFQHFDEAFRAGKPARDWANPGSQSDPKYE